MRIAGIDSRSITFAILVMLTGPLQHVVVMAGPIIIEDDVPIERGFARETVVSGLEHPWGIAWLPDGTLLISVGDGGNPPVMLNGRLIRKNAQDLSNQLGTLVCINDDGTIPADNPFEDDKGARRDIFSYGHRNIQGLAYDGTRKVIWATEHGSLGGDELNRPQAGKNYGWPAVTYSREYFDGSKISPHVSQPGMVSPLVVWLTAIA